MRSRKHKERGMSLVVMAMVLLALLGVSALAIDLGVFYVARTSTQHAADAAALAGAFTFLNPSAVQPQAAQQAAIAVAGQNAVLGTPVTITTGDVLVDVGNRLVTVNVARTGADGVQTVFAKAIGYSRVDIASTATAQASESASSSRCVKPVFVPNTLLSDRSPDDACGAGEVIFDQGGNLTAFAQSRLGGCALIRPMSPGDVEQELVGAGHFFTLNFGAGADTYRCTWSECLNEPVCNADYEVIACGSSYPVQTGAMVGPTQQGVRNLVGDDPDIWVAPGVYERSDGTRWDTSQQLAHVPIWDNCANYIKPGTAGQTANVIGFLDMFVAGLANQNGCKNNSNNGTWVKVHSVNATGCAGAGGGGSDGGDSGSGNVATGPSAVPIRLVRTQ